MSTYDSDWYAVGLSFTMKQRRKTRLVSQGGSSSIKLVQLEEKSVAQIEKERLSFGGPPSDSFTDHAPEGSESEVVAYDGSYNRITGKATEHKITHIDAGDWEVVGVEIVRSDND